jgi:hypothetical protein
MGDIEQYVPGCSIVSMSSQFDNYIYVTKHPETNIFSYSIVHDSDLDFDNIMNPPTNAYGFIPVGMLQNSNASGLRNFVIASESPVGTGGKDDTLLFSASIVTSSFDDTSGLDSGERNDYLANWPKTLELLNRNAFTNTSNIPQFGLRIESTDPLTVAKKHLPFYLTKNTDDNYNLHITGRITIKAMTYAPHYLG